jgi:type I restriction enzyme M protein
MSKQQLASKIWRSANKMRSKIAANEYKDYILGLIFYKFLSDKELKFLKENGISDEEIKTLCHENHDVVDFTQKKLGYFIAYKDLFSTWIGKGRDFDVSNVRDGLSAFNRFIHPHHKKLFTDIFSALQNGLSKLGDTTASQTKALSDLIQLIKVIPMDGKQDYDVIGFIYEYLLSNFAANAGKAGEFYTPHEVSVLMSEIVADHLKNKNEISIYDPTSGSGSLMINIGKSIEKFLCQNDHIKYYAQELIPETYNLTRMNLIMRDIIPENLYLRKGDSLEQDWPFFDDEDPSRSYVLQRVDAVVSNPPYSQEWDPSHKENDAAYSRFGLAPRGKADFAFLLHALCHLDTFGIMAIVLPHGVLFRGDPTADDGEGRIRRNLIEQNHVDTIIGLPPNMFFGTPIATIIMILRRHREHDDTLFIDASRGFIKDGKKNKLRAADIKKIYDTVVGRLDIDKYSRKVPKEEIRQNEYNLNIPRYVDSSETPETYDLYSSMFGGLPKSELSELSDSWQAFPSLWNELFIDDGTPYVSVRYPSPLEKGWVRENQDVKKYISDHQEKFADFRDYLKNELIYKMSEVNIAKQESIFSDEIFLRLSHIPLVDKYDAYQMLDDQWTSTATDLEILQSQGFGASKVVDPNFVIKTKDDIEYEVQEGFKGRIIPFDLVQVTILKKDRDKLKLNEEQITVITNEIESIFESLTEEEKDDHKEAINDAGDAFSLTLLNKYIKKIKLPNIIEEDTIESKLSSSQNTLNMLKQLKSTVKKQTEALHLLTKTTIENLSDEQVLMLLEKKWIDPIVNGMNEMPNAIINDLVKKVKDLNEKYKVTYKELANKTAETEKTIADMIDQLTGNEYDKLGLKEFQKILKGK